MSEANTKPEPINEAADNELERRFTYHQPTEGQVESMQDMRWRAKGLAYCISNNVPDSREKALALTKLEEAIMHANSGVVRRAKGEESRRKEE